MRRFRNRHPRRPWSKKRRVITASTLTVALLAGAGVNGWMWLPTGRAVVRSVERASEQLPHVGEISGRVLFISPHPDDETLAAAGLLQDIQARGGEVHVTFLTNGDGFPWEVRTSTPRPFVKDEDYLKLGRLRMIEARRATARLGIPEAHLSFMGFPDRGLSMMGSRHYLVPYRSPYTGKTSVPYEGVYEPNAPYTGQALEALLARLFDEVKPDVVFAPSVLDGHPDHRAASYVTTRLASQRNLSIYYYIVHGGVQWPRPKGFHPDLPLSPPTLDQQGIRWNRFDLTPEQEEGKVAAIREYKSQLRLLSRFMWAFARDNELILPAPNGE